MNAEEFWSEFGRSINTNADKLKPIYTGHNKAFTKKILELCSDIVKSDSHSNNSAFKSEKEYYRIDLISYVDRKEEANKITGTCFGDFTPSLWNLSVALEHENAHNTWCNEAMKLAYICCPLRVVIGYVNIPKDQPNVRDDVKYLNLVANLFDQLPDYAKNNLCSGEYMIILGNSNVNKGAYDQYFNYKAYILNYDDLGKFTFKSI